MKIQQNLPVLLKQDARDELNPVKDTKYTEVEHQTSSKVNPLGLPT